MRSLPPLSTRTRAAHIFALYGFAVAQPVFELLQDEPFWLAVQGYDGIDVVVYGLALLIVPPLVLICLEVFVGLFHSRAAQILHGVLIVVLGFLVLIRPLDGLPLSYRFGLALGIALFFERLYRGRYAPRLFLTVCSVAPVLFLAVFFVRAPIAELSTTEASFVAAPKVESRTPVVLVIFDEFAVSSLQTQSGGIDRIRYPNFARLERSSSWYRNATTVHDYTFWAVPSILTGRRPENRQLPVLADHPQNLFSLLGRKYEVHAFEPVTRLCPTSLCPIPERSLGRRVRDAAAHLKRSWRPLVTSSYDMEIPDWSDPQGQVSRFLASIRPRAGGQLYVLHVLLPHGPWHYLPSGHVYRAGASLAGVVDGRWTRQRRFADHAYQRHLLQVGYADRVLGQVVRRLQATSLWNRSLFVVTADHGISFWPGKRERTVGSENLSDIALVPLFVKRPWQREGAVDDAAATIVDIVPTIADVLQIRVPWQLDGRSLLSDERARPSEAVMLSIFGDRVRAPWADIEADRKATIARKTKLFGSGRDPRLVVGLSQMVAEAALARR